MPGALPRRTSGRSLERTLFTEPVLFVSRTPKPTNAGDEYGVFDGQGIHIGAVTVTTPSFLRRLIQLLWKSDQYVGRRFEVRDADQSTVLKVATPAKDPVARFIVTRADETPIGKIAPDGNGRFALRGESTTIATATVSARHPWEVAVEDHSGTEVARVARIAPDASPISGDACVVEIPQQVPEPLASMLVAATLTMDIAFAPQSR